MDPRSESEYTATVGMSISRQVRMIRQAMSPRLAMSNLVTGMALLEDGPSQEGNGVIMGRCDPPAYQT